MILSLIMVLAMVPFTMADGSATQLLTAPAHGDQVVVYYPDGGTVINTTVNTYNGNDRFEGTAATVANGVMAEVPADAMVLDVAVDGNGNYTFT